MYEEVLGLGFDIGAGKEVEDIYGSTWDEKIPKDEVMRRLVAQLGISGENVLVLGDGRSEISAGAALGAVNISILPETSVRQRELHCTIGTNMILPDFRAADLMDIFHA
jgi:phosphoglycolate phosphatase-like HAD superfamily hydrolase